MKLQPYLDFWVSETEMDFSCPACVLLWCLSVPLVSLPLSSFSVFLSRRPLLLKRRKRAAIVLVPPSFPPKTPPFLNLDPPLPWFPHFGMLMFYLLTLCMNDNMSVYSSKCIPFPWCSQKMVRMLYRSLCSSLIQFSCICLNVCRALFKQR